MLTQPTSAYPPAANSTVAATAAGICENCPTAPTQPWTRANCSATPAAASPS